MILPIRLWPDPVLGRVAAAVTAFDADLARLAADMLETMYAAPGRGLAGPQVGVLSRVFVMDVGWKDGDPQPVVAVNPVLSDPSEALEVRGEGCLSLPGLTVEVARPAEVTMDWQDTDGRSHRARLTGFAAVCAQHETDHLDGILTLDRIGAEALAEIGPALSRLKDGT